MSSGVAPIFVDSAGQNRILVVKGANDRLAPGRHRCRRRRCCGPPIASCSSSKCRSRRCTTRCVSRAGTASGRSSIPLPASRSTSREIANADYVIPNETEAEALSGMPVADLDGREGLRPRAARSRAARRDHHAGRERRAVRRRARPGAPGDAGRYHRRGRRVHRRVRDISGRGCPEAEARKRTSMRRFRRWRSERSPRS